MSCIYHIHDIFISIQTYIKKKREFLLAFQKQFPVLNLNNLRN